jgi:hypothetical protein
MSPLALFALLAFLLGVGLLLSVMWLLRMAGAVGRPMSTPDWLPLTLSGVFERWGDSRTVCAARRDPVFHRATVDMDALSIERIRE